MLGLWVGGCWVSAREGHERFIRTASDLGGTAGGLTPPFSFYSEYALRFSANRPPFTDQEVARLAASTDGLLNSVLHIYAPAEDALTEEQIATLLRTAPAVSVIYTRGGWWSRDGSGGTRFLPDPAEDPGPITVERTD